MPSAKKHKVRHRIVDLDKKCAPTIRGLINAVGVLESWLLDTRDEKRVIEDIPAAELDSYLSDFFSLVKKPNGEDYDPGSYRNLRSFIDRFLKEKGYPHLIKRSPLFKKSRTAFEARKQVLVRLAAFKKPAKSAKQTITSFGLPNEFGEQDVLSDSAGRMESKYGQWDSSN